MIDNSGQIDVIFLDLSKAFDKISHSGLTFKLNKLGFPCTLVKWIISYLELRRQFVDLNGSYSDPLPVISGVPQGSVLGPLLFLIYINDISTCVNQDVNIRLFADDCSLFKTFNNANDQVSLNESLDAILTWCNMWGMTLNPEIVFMRITNKKSPLSTSIQLTTPLLV